MQIEKITYKRVKNLGNYQSETVELVADLDPDDNPTVAFVVLKKKALEYLEIPREPIYDDSEISEADLPY